MFRTDAIKEIMKKPLTLMLSIVVITLTSCNEKDDQYVTTAYIVDTKNAVSLSEDKKLLVKKFDSFSEMAKIINDEFGSDESMCIQKVWDNSTNPIGFIIENSNSILRGILFPVVNKWGLDELEKTSDLLFSDTRVVNEIAMEHQNKIRLIDKLIPANSKPIEELSKCTEKLKGWILITID